VHLIAYPWYLECNFGTFPHEEETLFESLKNSDIVDFDFDKFAGLDMEAKAKTIKRRKISDKKKLENLDEAKKKFEENQKKRLAVAAEKEQDKAWKEEKKMKRRGRRGSSRRRGLNQLIAQ